MNVETAIRRAIPVLALRGGSDPAVVKAWLLRAGLSAAQAHDAVRFIPIALARIVLDGMGVVFSETYVRSTDNQERALSDEPFFRETARLARTLPGDQVTGVAMLSSEFQALNNALNGGANIDGLVAGPPVMTWERGDEVEAKPWWKFWA